MDNPNPFSPTPAPAPALAPAPIPVPPPLIKKQSIRSFLFSPNNPRALWVRYIFAAVLIIFAISLTHFVPDAVVKEVREKTGVINISGKQRMLSQRVLFLASHIVDSPSSRPAYVGELGKTVDIFERGHNALLNGGDLGITEALPPSLLPLYNTPLNGLTLDERVKGFIKDARLISSSTDEKALQTALERLIASGFTVQLTQLDGAVKGYELYTQTKVDRIQMIALFGFCFAMLILAFEAFFVFLPAHRSINHALDNAEAYAFRLEQNNADLSHFAYIASHDLMAPLRGMANLVAWIKEDLPKDTTPEVRNYLALLDTRVERMDALLKDILNFSRAGKATDLPENIEIDEIIDEVKSWVKIPENFSVETLGDMPNVYAPRSILQQCFLNLISNGIKHHDKDHGTVTIAYQANKTAHVFIIEDDGPGISAEYHDYVFEMFHRLKTRDEVEGSGIGLAIIKRMMESLGGSVLIDVDPVKDARGTRFILSLPKTIMI